jgi:biopolymer transport protein TolQ
MERIFEAGYREFTKLRGRQNIDTATAVDGARRAMRATYQRELDELESHTAFLASTGSVSPYIGLFGTVWGIMNAFRGLSNVGQATLAQVAPGIAEALVATAIGLFAAIPAVVAYNRFAHDIERHGGPLRELHAEEFSNDPPAPEFARLSGALPDGRKHLPPQAAQAEVRDQRRALHRRDAGAARSSSW